LHFLAGGFAFFAVGVSEIVVELEVPPQAGGMARKLLVFSFQRRAISAWDKLNSSDVSRRVSAKKLSSGMSCGFFFVAVT
jgi:hypothetical protein